MQYTVQYSCALAGRGGAGNPGSGCASTVCPDGDGLCECEHCRMFAFAKASALRMRTWSHCVNDRIALASATQSALAARCTDRSQALPGAAYDKQVGVRRCCFRARAQLGGWLLAELYHSSSTTRRMYGLTSVSRLHGKVLDWAFGTCLPSPITDHTHQFSRDLACKQHMQQEIHQKGPCLFRGRVQLQV